ncbi:phospholipid/cholesterol/gamma-HCH transport system permease protein [Halospina denitrificans]|uniref:Phospholipid/cholesterol/gamma-HCH transport system permease protein n=2 Tax=Halospina denitrificans TaxID=332522 RepID=A0A4R7K0N3_9GAMM|nr:phospholipid/cholesterol/gamma-HCH transport system permease protein [Halospina denitrificans]
MRQEQSAEPLWSVSDEGDSAMLVLRGDWQPGEGQAFPSASAVLKACPSGIKRLDVDAGALESWHGSVLPALLYGLETRLEEKGAALHAGDLDEELQALLDLTRDRIGDARRPLAAPLLERVWEVLLGAGNATYAVGVSVVLYMKGLGRLASGSVGFRARDFLDALTQSGVQALPIITLVSLLVGSILAFVGALQLQDFGAEIYIPEMVGVAVAREMAAMMTAIVMAGRTGAAFAAHLASMEVNEEVDALKTLGVSSYDFLAFPRILALTLMMPLLYLYASAISILGGLIVSMLALGLEPAIYLARTFEKVALYHFYIGLLKSVCFGALIGMVSCHIGLRSGRSAAAVGESATRAVVISIVGIIAVDSVFAIVSTLTGA